MTTENPHYSTLLVFGKEEPRSVASPASFREIVEAIAAFIDIAGSPLKCRGRIDKDGTVNGAPRTGRLTASLVDRWMDALKGGRFRYVEVFDVPRSSGHCPRVYASTHKLGPSAVTHVPDVGAENFVIVAIRRDLIADRIGALEDFGLLLVSMLSGFYGCVELNVQWGRERGGGSYQTDLIDMRWHDRTWNDYRNGLDRMDNVIPRLYWGNILSRSHFKDGNPNSVPRWAVARLETLSHDLFYMRFIRDPQEDIVFQVELMKYFNFVPGIQSGSTEL